jgi:hypothetical protein
MRPSAVLLTLSLLAAATPALADVRYLAFDATDRLTQSLTRGVTLEVERGLFGSIRVNRLFSTTSRGSATFERGGPAEALSVLPSGASGDLYEVQQVGDGRGLARALCPAADQVWLAIGRVRAARPLSMQAVGRWPDGKYRHCAALAYEWRGEWATRPPSGPAGP